MVTPQPPIAGTGPSTSATRQATASHRSLVRAGRSRGRPTPPGSLRGSTSTGIQRLGSQARWGAPGAARCATRTHSLGRRRPVWSADGTSLLLPLGGVVPVDGSPPRKLPADDPRSLWNATYSPDGADVAYITEDGLAVAAGDGSQARVLVPGCVEGYQAGPPGLAWSPTGDRIAFAFEPCGAPRDMSSRATELSIVDVASGTVVSLADIGGPDDILGYLRFSPKGDQILFSRTDSQGWGLFTVERSRRRLRPPPIGGWNQLGRLATCSRRAVTHDARATSISPAPSAAGRYRTR